MPSKEDGQGTLYRSFFSKNSRPIMTGILCSECAIFSIHTIAPHFNPQQLSASVPAFNTIPSYFIILYWGLLQLETCGPS